MSKEDHPPHTWTSWGTGCGALLLLPLPLSLPPCLPRNLQERTWSYLLIYFLASVFIQGLALPCPAPGGAAAECWCFTYSTFMSPGK